VANDQIQAPDFLDMTSFYLAVAAVDRVLSDLDSDPALHSGVDAARLRAHRGDATIILRRISPSVDAGIDSICREAAEKAKLRIKTRLDQALRGSGVMAYANRTQFLEFFLPRLKSHQNVLRDVFGDDSSQAIRVVQASEVESPIPRLFKLAGIRMASGGKLTVLKKWIQESTEICGNPVSEVEEVAVDVAATDAILDRVMKNNRKLDVLDPTDPVAAAVSEENADLMNKVTRVAEKSKDPASVKAHAASKLAKGGDGVKGGYATTIGATLKMTPEQEDAMMARGKVVMAAGAGSGKTRVLAGKVVHHISDLGLNISNVMAVSFTRKSSAELRERILKYAADVGVNLPDPGSAYESFRGIGTTHSIGRDILKRSGRGYRVSANKNDKDAQPITGSEQSNLIKVAILQVKMRAQGGVAPEIPNDAMTFFPNPPPRANKIDEPDRAPFEPGAENPAMADKSPIANPVEEKSPLAYYFQDEARFKSIIQAAMDTLRDIVTSMPEVKTITTGSGWHVAELFGPGIQRFGNEIARIRIPGSSSAFSFKPAEPRYRSPDRYTAFAKNRAFDKAAVTSFVREALGIDRAENGLKALEVFAASSDPNSLSENEKQIFQSIITQPAVAFGLTARGVLVKPGVSEEEAEPMPRFAADDDTSGAVSEKGIESASQRKLRYLDHDKSPFYYWMHNPASQWFNIGATEADFKTTDAKGEEKDIPVGEFLRFVGLRKNSLVAPGAAFKEGSVTDSGVGEDEEGTLDQETLDAARSKRVFSAVYGAYEWLKGNVPQLKGRLDYDDQLVIPSRELIENPQLLTKYQKQFKCVLVDEAQDLNKAQHLLFGMLAGYIDPATQKPRADGKMSADTFALIGDDKQAIYEFRAADPGEFIDKSDLVPNGAGFATKLLDTNFRSGSAIVEAANKLIAYNSKQIPMVCKTDPAKGEGTIRRASVKTPEDGAAFMADSILADFEEAKQNGTEKGFYSRYGLAVRTNREVYGYAMAMIERGIPFKSKKNFLAGPAIGPIIGLFSIMRTDDVQARNEGVLAGLKAPDYGINARTIRGKMEELRVRDFYKFLVEEGGASQVYSYRKMADKLQDYADYLEEIVKVGTSGSATDVIDLILNSKGPDGDTFVDSLSASLLDDAEAMEEIQMKATEENDDGKVTPEMLANYALAPIEPLRRAAERFPTAIAFVDFISSLVESNKKNSNDGDTKADAVQIDTVHGWKGLETANLFVPMWQGGFPHRRSSGDPKLMESERRLAYVALTRGQQSVTILEPRMDGIGKDISASQFMYEACVPLSGTTETDAEKSASASALGFEDYLKSAHPLDFVMPYSDDEYLPEEMPPAEMVPVLPTLAPEEPDDLESAWGTYADSGEI